MARTVILAATLALTGTVAHAQACLSLSDGFGNTTVSCPDGRSGLLRTDPAGGVTGLIGGQPYSGTAAGIDPAGLPAGIPSTSYLVAPPPPSISPPSAPPPALAATLEPLSPQVELTQLQREYQAEQQSFRLRRAAAEAARAREAAKPAASPPAAAPGRSTRPAGSGR